MLSHQGHGFQRLAQVQRLLSQLELPHLAAGQVQHVPDQAAQLLGADMHTRQILPVWFRQRLPVSVPLPQHHFAQAHQQHQRREQFVAHHREKAALEEIGFLGQPLSRLGRFLGFQRLMVEFDVFRQDLHPLERTADVVPQHLGHVASQGRPVQQDKAQLFLAEVEGFDDQAVLLIGGQQRVRHQVAGRETPPAGFHLDTAGLIVGQDQPGPSIRFVRILVQAEIATGDAQLR